MGSFAALMWIALVTFVLSAAPSQATITALGCKGKKCKFTPHSAGSAGTVWQVTRVGVTKVDDTTCRENAQEWWLVSPDGAKTQKLLSICNDGYGASGVGEDTVEVKGATFNHSRYGGSAWRWGAETVLSLDPLQVITERSSSFHSAAPNLESSTSWSWEKFEGTWSASVSPCNAEGAPDFEAPNPLATGGNLVPQVALPDSFRDGGWKTTSLGACSTTASFVTFGKQSGPGDASLRVVSHQGSNGRREVYVEVTDDAFVEKAARWPLADHVELWLSDEIDPWQACSGRKSGVQWGVALDGTVSSGFGAPRPTALGVEVARADGVARMKLLLPKADSWYRVGLVYSDSDDGLKQKALLATSQLKFASVVTFSPWRLIPEGVAVCQAVSGALQPSSTRTFAPDKAVIE